MTADEFRARWGVSPRDLGPVLLDLMAERRHWNEVETRLSKSTDPTERNHLDAELSARDKDIARLEQEAKASIEMATGVAYEHIAEANL